MIRRRLATMFALLLSVASLVSCAGPLSPEEVEWQLVAQGPIVAMDNTTGVYVEGYIGRHGGEIDSRGVIDYKYARKLSDGGFRQDLVSLTYERITKEHNGFTESYPGADVVTVYQDAQPDGSDSRIEIYFCSNGGDNWSNRCVMPDGGSMLGTSYRVDIHIPPDALIQTFDDNSPVDNGDE